MPLAADAQPHSEAVGATFKTCPGWRDISASLSLEEVADGGFDQVGHWLAGLRGEDLQSPV